MPREFADISGNAYRILASDIPPGIGQIPGQLGSEGIGYLARNGEIKRSPGLGPIYDIGNLRKAVREYIKNVPGLSRKLRDGKKDVIARLRGREAEIIVGIGVAALVVAGAITGVVVHKRRHKKT